ncbi:MAG: SDR family oxidoreductase [Filomicrobium sp.]
MRVLLLGAYGLIGQSVARALTKSGHHVVGLSRSPKARVLLPEKVSWVSGDLNQMLAPKDWLPLLEGVDAVVNASGALQTGSIDDLSKVQRDSILALIDACQQKSVTRFVQISAPGADPQASTEFYATKGEADTALRASQLDWVILKPGLVISPTAYGGTSLLRMLAAVPEVQPIFLADAKIQTVAVDEVSRATVLALERYALVKREFDLVEPEAQSLLAVVQDFRKWLGFPEPAAVVSVPALVGHAVGRLADVAGWFGWRSPLRTTALQVLSEGVRGDPESWRDATGLECGPLATTLDRLPSTRQERVFARMQLVFAPLLIGFAAFWIVSGLIGLWQLAAARDVVAGPLGPSLATTLVVFGGLADILVGVGLLFRRTFVLACQAAIALSVGYMIAASLVVPALWADPLGPLVKILPVIGTAIALLASAEER